MTVAASLLVMRSLVGLVEGEPTARSTRAEVQLPAPDSMRATSHVIHGAEAQTPLSMSIPLSDHYVSTTRQLITEKQPFEPKVLYVTTQTLGVLKVAWLALTLLLGWQFRGKLTTVWATVKERLAKRPPPIVKPARPPVPVNPFVDPPDGIHASAAE